MGDVVGDSVGDVVGDYVGDVVGDSVGAQSRCSASTQASMIPSRLESAVVRIKMFMDPLDVFAPARTEVSHKTSLYLRGSIGRDTWIVNMLLTCSVQHIYVGRIRTCYNTKC